ELKSAAHAELMKDMKVCSQIFSRGGGKPRPCVNIEVIADAFVVIRIDLNTAKLVDTVQHSPDIHEQAIGAVLILIGSVRVVVVATRNAIVFPSSLDLFVDEYAAVGKS